MHLMPFAPVDYLTSPRVLQLIAERRYGTVLAYVHFLFAQWINQGPIRFENAAGAFHLGGLRTEEILKYLTAGCTCAAEKSLVPGDGALIHNRDGFLWNERVKLDLLEEEAYRTVMATSGKKGAEARKQAKLDLATLQPPLSLAGTKLQPPAPAPVPAPNTGAAKGKRSVAAPGELASLARRYVDAFNATHSRKHSVTPTVIACVRAALEAEPPYSIDQLIAAVIVSDDWYSEREPSYPIRFRRAGKMEGKSHLDDLLAQISPGAKFGPRIAALAKEHGVAAFFRERVKR